MQQSQSPRPPLRSVRNLSEGFWTAPIGHRIGDKIFFLKKKNLPLTPDFFSYTAHFSASVHSKRLNCIIRGYCLPYMYLPHTPSSSTPTKSSRCTIRQRVHLSRSTMSSVLFSLIFLSLVTFQQHLAKLTTSSFFKPIILFTSETVYFLIFLLCHRSHLPSVPSCSSPSADILKVTVL